MTISVVVHLVHHSGLILQFGNIDFRGGGKAEYPEKKPFKLNIGENQQQARPQWADLC